MSLQSHSAESAVINFNRNSRSRWWRSGIDVTDTAGDFAVQRLAGDTFVPAVPPSDLRIAPTDQLFAIGSCFARGIELAMVARGFDVPSYASELDAFELANADVTGRGFTNKYTTFAVENEVRWAIDPAAEFPVDSLVDLADGTVIDPHCNPTLKWVDRESTLERRRIIHDVYARLDKARIVVITLGLVETWFDEHAGCYLNMTPTPAMRQLHHDRYRFEATSFEQNAESFARTVDALSSHGHPDVQIVVTVSPVPLMATFTDRDVVVANAYSKSLLRVVAEEAASRHPNVHYFPSYEMVTMSSRQAAWEADGRHVRGPMVNSIMDLFVSTFVDS